MPRITLRWTRNACEAHSVRWPAREAKLRLAQLGVAIPHASCAPVLEGALCAPGHSPPRGRLPIQSEASPIFAMGAGRLRQRAKLASTRVRRPRKTAGPRLAASRGRLALAAVCDASACDPPPGGDHRLMCNGPLERGSGLGAGAGADSSTLQPDLMTRKYSSMRHRMGVPAQDARDPSSALVNCGSVVSTNHSSWLGRAAAVPGAHVTTNSSDRSRDAGASAGTTRCRARSPRRRERARPSCAAADLPTFRAARSAAAPRPGTAPLGRSATTASTSYGTALAARPSASTDRTSPGRACVRSTFARCQQVRPADACARTRTMQARESRQGGPSCTRWSPRGSPSRSRPPARAGWQPLDPVGTTSAPRRRVFGWPRVSSGFGWATGASERTPGVERPSDGRPRPIDAPSWCAGQGRRDERW